MGWLDEVVDYVNQKGQGLGAGIYDSLRSGNFRDEEKALEFIRNNALSQEEQSEWVMTDAGLVHKSELPEGSSLPYVARGGLETGTPRGTMGTGWKVGDMSPDGTKVEAVMPDGTFKTGKRWYSSRDPLPPENPNWMKEAKNSSFYIKSKTPVKLRAPSASSQLAGKIGALSLLPLMTSALSQAKPEQLGIWLADKVGAGEDTPAYQVEEDKELLRSLGYDVGEPEPEKTKNQYVLPSTEEYTPAGGKLSEYSMREGEGIEAYKQRLGTGNQGTPSEEIKKAWGKPNPETGKMEGGVSGLGDIVSNKKLFARETPIEPEKTTEEQRMTDAEKKMLSAKKAAINVLGYDPENLDPDREALGNTYRYFMGKYYTPQQYAQVYNYYYKEAMEKKKNGMTAVSHVMDKLMAETANVRSLEEIRRANLEQRKKEHEERMELRQKQAEEKRLAGHKENVAAIEKSINMLFAPYVKLDATTDVVDPNKLYYSIPQDMQEAYREVKAKAERYNKSENLTPQEAAQKAFDEVFSTRTEDRVDRLRGFIQRRYPKYATMNDEGKADLVKKLKGWGYTDAEISRAFSINLSNQSKYTIKQVS